MKKYLFECGHVSEGNECKICGCSSIQFQIHNIKDHLEGREAICNNHIIKSRWDLPGFIYRPNEKYDLYFFGNTNKIFNSGIIYKIGQDKDEIRND